MPCAGHRVNIPDCSPAVPIVQSRIPDARPGFREDHSRNTLKSRQSPLHARNVTHWGVMAHARAAAFHHRNPHTANFNHASHAGPGHVLRRCSSIYIFCTPRHECRLPMQRRPLWAALRLMCQIIDTPASYRNPRVTLLQELSRILRASRKSHSAIPPVLSDPSPTIWAIYF